MKISLFVFFLLSNFISTTAQDLFYKKGDRYQLSEKGASHLASLPLKCIGKEFPYKTGIVFLDSSYTVTPKEYHPAFFGCYDWHSSVHGHWMLIRLLKQFPALPEAATIREKLSRHLSAENIKKEIEIFKADNLSFERIYGWGWLLNLQKELITWNDPWARGISANIQPLAELLSGLWIKFLNRIVYPIRVGEHTNLAYGLSFTWDYAVAAGDTALQRGVKDVAQKFYLKDRNCPSTWEPGGYDFLSPCLEEAKLMSRILNKSDYLKWLKQFLPALFTRPANLYRIAIVKDRTDGKLVHLDGLNFSRAACLYAIAKKVPSQNAAAIRQLASRHLEAALPNVVSGSYAGEHWLASFAVNALSE